MVAFDQKPLGRMRSFLWPIRRKELGKFVPIFLIFFLLTFIYDLLRTLKTALVVSASHVGAEIIPFIKVWAMLPSAFLFASLCISLSHRFNREQIFYLVMGLFIGFFGLFQTVIYPWRETLELVALSDWFTATLPQGMGGFAMMVRHWPLTLFYVMTEMWGCIVLSMLFWGFANEVTAVDEAKRFYPFFLLGANLAAVCAGQIGTLFTRQSFLSLFSFGADGWERSLAFFVGITILGAVGIVFLFWWIHRGGTASGNRERVIQEDSKVKLNLRECLVILLRSRHLLCIAMLVFSYNIVFNLSDVLWMNELRQRFHHDIGGLTRYLSEVTTMTGILAFFISLLVSGNVLRHFGWKATALITPVMITFSACGFFFFLLFQRLPHAHSLIESFQLTPLNLAILFGSLQMCISRGCKYTVFDTSKEIAFIPLPKHEQRYGKAAIDGVGSRLGKSTGSLIYQLLFLVSPSIADATPVVSVVVFIIIVLWIVAIRSLAGRLDTAPAIQPVAEP